MPIAIAILGRERTIATLARKVFQLDASTGSALQRRAEAALLSANPRLATADGFRSGASIVVPSVEGLQPADTVAQADASGDGIGGETRLRFQAAASRIEDRFDRAAALRKETLGRIADRGFQTEARKVLPQSLDLIKNAHKRLLREEAEAEKTAAQFQSAISQAIEGVEALEKVMPRRGSR